MAKTKSSRKKFFSTRRSGQTEIKSYSLITHTAEPNEVGLVQGQTPGSVEEWRVAVALWEMGLDFDYQYIIGEGRPSGARGIFKLDFLIYANPSPVGLEVQSVRWHSAQFSPDELFRLIYIENELKIKILYLWEDQLGSQEEATEAARDLLGRYV